MYYRIKNQLDAEFLSEEIARTGNYPSIIADRIVEITNILDDAYGANRSEYDMGGYVLLFPNTENYSNCVNRILEFYHLKLDDCEYSERIGEQILDGGRAWNEDLYLLGSDDSLVLIYPQEAGKR